MLTLSKPNCNEGKLYDGQEHGISFVVACADLSELLEPAKKAFHHISPLICFFVIFPGVFAVTLWRNDGFMAVGGGQCAGFIAFIRSVHQQRDSRIGVANSDY